MDPRMPQTLHSLLVAVAAISATALFAAAAQADPLPENVLHGRSLKRDAKREVHTLVLPQLFAPEDYKGRRYKDNTILQLDAKLSDRSDILIRIQAKQKKFFYLEIRF